MRVMCIVDGFESDEPQENDPSPVFGETYNVVDDWIFKGHLYYELAEFPGTPFETHWFDSDAFSPLSDIDEAELANKRQKPVTI